MRQPKIGIWTSIVCLSLLTFSCQKTSVNPAAQTDSNQGVEISSDESSSQPPFATKEPEKYSAKIVFAFRYDEAAANLIEQTYFVARDGANRRLDFTTGASEFSRLQIADGKQFILLPKQKVYAELSAPDDLASSKNIAGQPDEFSLERLLYAKPIGATFRRIGEEEILNRKTTKYQLDFGQITEAENIRTDTFVWADESLGLPIKTEITAIENGSATGAKNVIELREINAEVDAQTFAVPAGFRKITFKEVQQIFRQK